MTEQKGFTLIELVVVIVILGILAATALPKFVDLSSDAKTAAIQGAAGALTSAATTNYASYMAKGGSSGTVAGSIIRLNTSTPAAALTAIMAAWDSTKFVIATDAAACSTAAGGAAATATLTYSGGTASVNSATATIICTG